MKFLILLALLAAAVRSDQITDNVTDRCALSPCAPGSTCINKQGSFECICPPGRTGHRCESGTCASDRECLNGGMCADDQCICKPEFDGPNCERAYRNPCGTDSCSDNKMCIRNQSEIMGFSCVCKPGLIGQYCEQTIHNPSDKEDERDLEQCSLSGCSELAGNGVCNQECNHFACEYDGGDCSEGTKPFERCQHKLFCAHRFHDGQCDERCNNEDCLFDGFDCAGPDPAARKNPTWADLPLIFLVKPETFEMEIDTTLNALTERLKTNVNIKNTDGEMDLFEWNSENGEGQRIRFGTEISLRTQRSMQEGKEQDGVLAVFQVELAECNRECFSDAYAVSLFIGAMEAKEPLNPEMPIRSPLRMKPNPKPPASGFPWNICFILFALVGLVGVVIVGGTVIKNRNIKNAAVWRVPPQPGPQKKPDYCLFYPVDLPNQLFDIIDPTTTMAVTKDKPKETALPPLTLLEMAAIGDERISAEMCHSARHIGQFNRTPLHWLALNTTKGAADIGSDCDLLIAYGVDLNAQDDEENAALHYACYNGRISLVRRLLEAGADPSIQNERDETPLHVAAKSADDLCMEILIGNEFYKRKKNLNLVDMEDRTPLMMYAANSSRVSNPSTRGAEILVRAGADVHYAGDMERMDRYKGRTALHHAAMSNRTNQKMFEFLLAEHADKMSNKDAKDAEGATALWLAVSQNNFLAVDVLLKAGANQDIKDHQMERTPVQLAQSRGYKEIIERLRVAGLSMFPVVPIHPPSIIREPPVKKRKIPVAQSSFDTTPSPSGLKASGSSCFDSPQSEQSRCSAGASSTGNSSSDSGSPYTPITMQQPMQPPMQQQSQQYLQLQHPAAMRPSLPLYTHDQNGFYAAPPYNQVPPATGQYSQNHAHNPYAFPFQILHQ